MQQQSLKRSRSLPREGASVGQLLRIWRQHRRLSQLALALEADISQRHLSFLESGKAQPSREMVLRLARSLSLPLRERNALLVAAGFAPTYPQRPLAAPELAGARRAIDAILKGHLPYPALAVDRHWTLIAANEAVRRLLAEVPPHLLADPLNVMRLSLDPEGLASRILNFREWRAHLLQRLAHEAEVSADPKLLALLDEMQACPTPPHACSSSDQHGDPTAIAIPFVLASPAGPLSFISTTTVFGTAVDVTLEEVTIEAFLPANAETAGRMLQMNAQS